ncbi:helix-turn-helix domain-containing protein [Brevibacillus choshinensis]|uniref:Helix-turn-helix domain-containing protein n=1 Tax=Brevibacillus choshinensis TaxID=54911 RepID=A0ABX7FI23_BRECH|nr:RodZ domain-containing protein [Brevibacillus choshinensis]QRG65423.1 helix-turn-helix domain-containing protein [Brevibacillus choshinensis]
MSELGQVLQRAREEKGITLDDVQRITKIQKRYLEAIERGHFHVLPGHFYARAFIKSYAEAVGLDPNHIMNHFQSDLPAQPPTEQVERLRRRRVASTNSPLQAGRWVTKTLLVLFIALIIGVIYIAVVNSNGGTMTQPPVPSGSVTPGAEMVSPGNGGGAATSPIAQQPNPPTTVTPTTPDPGTVTTDPVTETPKTTITFESQQGSMYNYAVAGEEKMTVKLKIKDDRSWFGISEGKGKKYVEEGELKKGEEKTIELGKSAYVRLGKPMTVELTVNGVLVDTSKMKSMPSNITLKMKETVTQ